MHVHTCVRAYARVSFILAPSPFTSRCARTYARTRPPRACTCDASTYVRAYACAPSRERERERDYVRMPPRYVGRTYARMRTHVAPSGPPPPHAVHVRTYVRGHFIHACRLGSRHAVNPKGDAVSSLRTRALGLATYQSGHGVVNATSAKRSAWRFVAAAVRVHNERLRLHGRSTKTVPLVPEVP